MPFEIDQRIDNELSGAVKGDISSSLDLIDLHPPAGHIFARMKKVCADGVAAESDDGGMFDKKDAFGTHLAPLLAGRDHSGVERALKVENLAVGPESEILDYYCVGAGGE